MTRVKNIRRRARGDAFLLPHLPILTVFSRQRVAAIVIVWLSLAIPFGRAETPSPAPGEGDGQAIAEVATNQYLFARGLLSRNFHQLAAEEFRSFLAQHPRHELAPYAWRGLIKALQAAGDNDEALTEIDRLRENWPEHAVARDIMLEKGYMLLQRGQFAEAEAALAGLSRDDRSEIAEAALYLVAQAREKQGDSQTAMRIYLSLASKPLDANHVYRAYALFAVLTSEVQTASERAVRRMERLLESEHVPAAIQEQAVLVCADHAVAREELDVARRLYERFLERFPDSPRVPHAVKAMLHVLQRLGQFDDALALAQEARQRDELADDPEVVFIAAVALVSLQRGTAAAPLFQQLVEAENTPVDIRRQANLGWLDILVETRDFDTAATVAGAFRETYADHPSAARAAYLQGFANFSLERYPAAKPALEQAIAGSEADSGQREHARQLLAACLERLEEFHEAAELYRDLAGAPPYDGERGDYRLAAARAEEKANRHAAAIADYEAVLGGVETGGPQSQRAANALVRLSFVQGDFARTIDILQGLIANTTGDMRLRCRLTLALAFMGANRLAESDAALRQALAEGPQGKLAGEIHAAVVELAVRQGEMQRAVDHFASLMDLPEEARPEWKPHVLTPLLEEFFKRNDYATSEKIGRILLAGSPDERRYAPTVRLAEILMATDRSEEATALLVDVQDDLPEDAPSWRKAEILSLLGEALLKQERHDQAYRAFERSLEAGGARATVATRSRWGMAVLLRREKRLDDAIRQAVGAFVLGNDAYYTPRAMLLAAEMFVEQGKDEQAENTWRELETRFPAFAEKNRRP